MVRTFFNTFTRERREIDAETIVGEPYVREIGRNASGEIVRVVVGAPKGIHTVWIRVSEES